MGFGAWLVVGLFVDGWAHNHEKPETIFTPWHAMFYSGFAACAVYARLVLRRARVSTSNWRERIPEGQGLVVVGLALFGIGGAADLLWHSIFGIEIDVAALLSPTHLLLFCGALFILTGPLRSAWSLSDDQEPTLAQFLPTLISLTLFTSLVAFFFMYLTPFRLGSYGNWVEGYTAAVTVDDGVAMDFTETLQDQAIAAVIVTTIIYVAPLLAVLRRWRTPFGTVTILFSTVSALVGGIDGFQRWQPLLAGPIAGLAADGLIHWLRPSMARPWSLRAVAGMTPLVLWLSFFALFGFLSPVGWEPELWAGVTVMAGLAGLSLSLLVAPPAGPVSG